MYKDFFGFNEEPFSIVPNRKFLFQSQRHKEAITQLTAGLSTGGGLAMLTGEVGTGKTLVSKSLLSDLSDDQSIETAMLLNPTYSETDLLEAICDEFGLSYPEQASLKVLSKAIHQFLKQRHSCGHQVLVIIDEAQHLSVTVLEQLRLLTNLESDEQKLLKVVLVGQPELQAKLQTPQLRQLAQRITGRYHLLPFTPAETLAYISFRINTAGGKVGLISDSACRKVAKASQGVPRLINLICDRALQMAYQQGLKDVGPKLMDKACEEVLEFQYVPNRQSAISFNPLRSPKLISALVGLGLCAGVYALLPTALETHYQTEPQVEVIETVVSEQQVLESVIAQALTSEWDSISAIQTVFALWGMQATAEQAVCDTIDVGGFHCSELFGSLEDVLDYNRPVLFELSLEGYSVSAILTRLDTQNAQLVIGDSQVTLSRQWLEQHWPSQYQMVWFTEIDQVLKRGYRGEAVERFAQALAQALNEASVTGQVFNNQLHQQVERFQTLHGLDVDGIVGNKTLMVLDSYVNSQAPTLTGAKQ
ncbi:AAA family ATPase [Vibrio sp. SCSIO 43136]|uniref:AAA family ATPase n=1 Tax=Vibrio sp. SCSIO 43136 TaxID=2819101 RepID=UPI002075C46C|nr:AAA family ATPase [Vibrio sp. SCSIO 43136]USD64914.1 AAA family ATPase [Vibrio sp. SCSIO 43136]